MNGHRRFRVLAIAAMISALGMVSAACQTLSVEEQAAKRAELDTMAEQTVEALRNKDPQFEPALESSLGYVVIDMAVAKIPVIGTGSGLGVVVDKRNDKRSYLKVSRFDIGGGVGAQKYKVVITFDDPALLDRAIKGAWHYEAGAEAGVGAGSQAAQGHAPTQGYQAFRIVESGAVATVTVRVARAKPWLD